MDNLRIWEQVREVPKEAQKPIGGGRLKGMTDINPVWRLKKMTEIFGVVGIGWYYDVISKSVVEGADGQKVAVVDIDLYIKDGDEWSKPIPGTGGSMFVEKERTGLYTSDECFKMALTDALSVSMKSLGIAADIYFGKDKTDRTKYTVQKERAQSKPQEKPKPQTEITHPQDLKSVSSTKLITMYYENADEEDRPLIQEKVKAFYAKHKLDPNSQVPQDLMLELERTLDSIVLPFDV